MAILDMPWRIRNHVDRVLLLPYIRVTFSLAGIEWRPGWKVFGSPILQRHAGSRILLGERLELRSTKRSNPLVPHQPVVLATRTKNALIRVGNDCGFTGAILVAAERVEIGDRVLLGANSIVVDTDFHPLTASRRRSAPLDGAVAAVTIEDDVFVGMQAIILKGVTLGQGSVVGAGSVVTKSVPAGSIVAGNPARIVGRV